MARAMTRRGVVVKQCFFRDARRARGHVSEALELAGLDPALVELRPVRGQPRFRRCARVDVALSAAAPPGLEGAVRDALACFGRPPPVILYA